MNFSGSFRTEATSFTNLGQTTGKESKQFILGRALLDPNLLIDDHFSIRSQWTLLTSPQFTPNAQQALGNGQGGFLFGDVQTASLNLNRAWLEWTSDFGVVRLGRVPISWGYGLTWDAGNRVWDDYQTTDDRLEYRLHLGNVIGALAYTKARKLSVLDGNDQDFYTVYLQYDNPELDVEGGIYFEKQSRTSDVAGVTGNGSDSSNPFAQPGKNEPPLALSAPSPKNNNAIDVYLKKTTGRFTFGGEVTWLSGKAYALAGGGEADLNAFGALANITYSHHKLKLFTEAVYATGDKNINDSSSTSFSLLHLNRARPGLILGRELLGQYHDNNVSQGNLLVYGANGSFSGLLYVRPGLRIDWSPAWASGVEVIFARKATTADGDNANLGWELDLGTDYNVYRNFDLGVNLGFAFPGEGIPLPVGGERKSIIAIRTTAALRF